MDQQKPRARRKTYIAPELTSYGSLQQQKGERSMFLEGVGNVTKCRLQRCSGPPAQFKFNC
jgi:hypothetical protein